MELHCCRHASLHSSQMECAVFHFSRLEEIDPIIHIVATHCPHPHKLSQGLSELMINAVEHGNLGICYDEKSKLMVEGNWDIEIARRLALPKNKGKYATLMYTTQPDGVILCIRDQGEGFDWQPYMNFDPERGFDPNGRGIAIAKSLDIWELEYQGSGNCVVCRIPT